MSDHLGLTEHHQAQIRELLRYSRFKRSERLIGIELCFQDFIETRLYEEETYTQDEVGHLSILSHTYYFIDQRNA